MGWRRTNHASWYSQAMEHSRIILGFIARVCFCVNALAKIILLQSVGLAYGMAVNCFYTSPLIRAQYQYRLGYDGHIVFLIEFVILRIIDFESNSVDGRTTWKFRLVRWRNARNYLLSGFKSFPTYCWFWCSHLDALFILLRVPIHYAHVNVHSFAFRTENPIGHRAHMVNLF